VENVKFIAWDIKNKKFIPIKTIVWNSVTGKIEGVCVEKQCEDGYPIPIEDVELMVYTGIRDRCGNEIYEGHIVRATGYFNCRCPDCKIKHNKHKDLSTGVIRMTQRVEIKYMQDFEWFEFDMCDKYEIIGNIYENPELMEGT